MDSVPQFHNYSDASEDTRWFGAFAVKLPSERDRYLPSQNMWLWAERLADLRPVGSITCGPVEGRFLGSWRTELPPHNRTTCEVP
jgi:hypothetical protein